MGSTELHVGWVRRLGCGSCDIERRKADLVLTGEGFRTGLLHKPSGSDDLHLQLTLLLHHTNLDVPCEHTQDDGFNATGRDQCSLELNTGARGAQCGYI